MEIQERNDTFKSLEAPSEGLYKEKGSKFLAFARRGCIRRKAASFSLLHIR